jgi:hypothetical protein
MIEERTGKMNERLVLTIVVAALSVGVSFYLGWKAVLQSYALCLSTTIFTSALLVYYNLVVRDASHGMAIMILPVATAWIWWRRATTGKPLLSPLILILLQVAYMMLYILFIHIQEKIVP